jgi:hypothetical protein
MGCAGTKQTAATPEAVEPTVTSPKSPLKSALKSSANYRKPEALPPMDHDNDVDADGSDLLDKKVGRKPSIAVHRKHIEKTHEAVCAPHSFHFGPLRVAASAHARTHARHHTPTHSALRKGLCTGFARRRRLVLVFRRLLQPDPDSKAPACAVQIFEDAIVEADEEEQSEGAVVVSSDVPSMFGMDIGTPSM